MSSSRWGALFESHSDGEILQGELSAPHFKPFCVSWIALAWR